MDNIVRRHFAGNTHKYIHNKILENKNLANLGKGAQGAGFVVGLSEKERFRFSGYTWSAGRLHTRTPHRHSQGD